MSDPFIVAEARDLYGRKDLPESERSFWRRMRERSPRAFWALAVLTLVFAGLVVTSALWYPGVEVKDPTPAQLARITDEAARLKALNDARATRNSVRGTLLQGIGGLLVLGTLWIGLTQVRTTRRGQDTDRFTKSIDQLGDSKVDVRLGGIYALQQIAKVRAYRRPVAEIFAAYLRTHGAANAGDFEQSETSDGKSSRVPSRDSSPLLRADLQGVLRVLILDRLWEQTTSRKLDLAYVRLPRADLEDAAMNGSILVGADLSGANLRGAQLQSSDLQDADLTGAFLQGADLSGADLSGATLRGAHLEEANLSEALLPQARLQFAALTRATLGQLDATGADFTGAIMNGIALDGAALQGASLAGATLELTSLKGATLDHAFLAGSNLAEAELDEASVHNTELDRVADHVEATHARLIPHPVGDNNEVDRLDADGESTETRLIPPAPTVGVLAALGEKDPVDATAIKDLFRSGTPAERILALGFMELRPDPDFLPIVLDSLKAPRSSFEQYHAVCLADRLAPLIPADRRDSLEKAIQPLAEEQSWVGKRPAGARKTRRADLRDDVSNRHNWPSSKILLRVGKAIDTPGNRGAASRTRPEAIKGLRL